MVAELPENARLVVVLRYQEEMEPTEIASALDMPINTVKSHLRRLDRRAPRESDG
jgi:RNA polymerase sigma-70 factor (ECF subfamily)